MRTNTSATRLLGAFLFSLLLLPALLPSCDMFSFPDLPDALPDAVAQPEADSGDAAARSGMHVLSDAERDELERTGHFLKLVNMPRNTQSANVSSVLVAHGAANIGKLNAKDAVKIYRGNGVNTVYLPLIYNDGSDFAEYGSFYVAFTIHVDAITSFVVAISDKILVEFEDGRGSLDVLTIPANGPADRRYLTFYGLPPNVQAQNVSKVFIYNQAGAIAQCEDYDQLSISNSMSGSTLRIPLSYIKPPGLFTETGSFYVSFDINVDAVTRFVIADKDRLLVNFVNGNGALYADDLPIAPPLPFLTVKSLPRHAVRQNFSNVFLYNTAGKVAQCANVNDIIVSRDALSATAYIPLVYSSDTSEYFYDSGYFIVSLTVTVDALSQIIINQSDNFLLQFVNGSGACDLSDRFGFFSGGLANESNTAAPIVAKDTTFEMNGTYFKLKNNTPVKNSPPSASSVVYVYASQNYTEAEFEYSTVAPTYVSSRKAYYSGDKRCLWKLIYFKDTPDIYAAKTYIEKDLLPTGLARYPISNRSFAVGTSVYSLSGASNPAPATVTLQPGAYVFIAIGAGGGPGGSGGGGGAGGSACELVLLGEATAFTAFAGSGGGAGGGAMSIMELL